ncbi:hypothetical protein KM043_012862 [Ampulex compressa]|nr:hypothetical protein KM043_012862 [Ampulex compressa]
MFAVENKIRTTSLLMKSSRTCALRAFSPSGAEGRKFILQSAAACENDSAAVPYAGTSFESTLPPFEKSIGKVLQEAMPRRNGNLRDSRFRDPT